MLTQDKLAQALSDSGIGSPVHFYERLESTNDAADKLARGGATEGTLVVAEEQTGGRGRGGRIWYTPPGCALAFSLILRPSAEQVIQPGGVGLVGAIAVADAVVAMGGRPQIKWPNDVLLEGRKVAGVLAEASWTGERLDFVILGIGVNVREGSVPPDRELDYPAGWLEAAIDRGVDRTALLTSIVQGVEGWYPRLGDPNLLAAWESKLAFRGEHVSLTNGDDLQGLLLGLTQDGWLRLATREGEVLELEPGDHRLRLAKAEFGA